MPRVFINWFLSRKGQTTLQKSNDLYGELSPNSRRTDIPKDMLPPENRLVEGRKYLDVAGAEFTDMTPIFKLAKRSCRRESKSEDRASRLSKEASPLPTQTLSVADL